MKNLWTPKGLQPGLLYDTVAAIFSKDHPLGPAIFFFLLLFSWYVRFHIVHIRTLLQPLHSKPCQHRAGGESSLVGGQAPLKICSRGPPGWDIKVFLLIGCPSHQRCKTKAIPLEELMCCPVVKLQEPHICCLTAQKCFALSKYRWGELVIGSSVKMSLEVERLELSNGGINKKTNEITFLVHMGCAEML